VFEADDDNQHLSSLC